MVLAAEDDKGMQISKGDRIIGATIIIENTTIGTTSNYNGEFNLKIKYSDSLNLRVNYYGLIQKNIKIDKSKKYQFIEVLMIPEIINLNELTIVGGTYHVKTNNHYRKFSLRRLWHKIFR